MSWRWKRNKGKIRMNLLVLWILIVILLAIVVAGEAVVIVPRKRSYEDLPGYVSERIESRDGVELQLWYTDSERKVMLVVHGHADHSRQMYDWYHPHFKDLGYDLAFVDLRNHGRSGVSGRMTAGLEESLDVFAAISHLHELGKWGHIVVFGTSMGGIASSLAVPKALKSGLDVRGLILDSIFVSLEDTTSRIMIKHHVIDPFRTLLIWYLFKFRYRKMRFPHVVEQLSKMQGIRKLVFHGSRDIETAPDIIDVLKESKIRNLRAVCIEGQDHSRLFRHPLFREEVKKFLQKV